MFFFTFQSLSQKGALLDTKLAEVDLYLNRLRSMGLGGPSSTELLLNNKPQHRNSMLTPGSGGGDQGGNFGSLPTAAINSSRFAHFISIHQSFALGLRTIFLVSEKILLGAIVMHFYSVDFTENSRHGGAL